MTKEIPAMKCACMLALAVVSCCWFGTPKAAAQNCNPWLSVKAWQGTYTLTSNDTGQAGNWSTTISHSAQGTVLIDQPPGICGPSLIWQGSDTQSQGSINDVATAPCGSGVGNQVWTISGSGSNLMPSAILMINPAAGTYVFFDGMTIPGGETLDSCGNFQSSTLPFLIMYPTTGWLDQTFPLPTSGMELKGTATLTGKEASFDSVVHWTVTWDLTPILSNTNDNVDNPCLMGGGSTISCQNQSLGEDVPITGTPFYLHYESERAAGRSGANAAATTDARSLGGWTLSVHHLLDTGSVTLFLGDGDQRGQWQLGVPVLSNGHALVTSQDGKDVYVFDAATGRHLQTVMPLTGAVKYQFGYDSAGYLLTVTDSVGNVTTIQRDSSEKPTAIISPYGQSTVLSLDANGYLSQVTDPSGHSVLFANDAGGLMISRADANGNVYSYQYDGNGALTKDSDSAGGSLTLSRANTSSGYTVLSTTALGRTTGYQTSFSSSGGAYTQQFTNTWPNGLSATETETSQTGQITKSGSLPDGTAFSSTLVPDPRWGLQAPLAANSSIAFGSLTMNRSSTRVINLSNPSNPFSLTNQTDTETINGRAYTSVFTNTPRRVIDTTPVGRKTITIFDPKERLSSVQFPGFAPAKLIYDKRGRLTSVKQSTRTTAFTYNVNGNPDSITDPMGLTSLFSYDLNGRLVSTTLPDGRVINYSYDSNGNVTSITPPGKPAHSFSFTQVNRLGAYTPPSVLGSGSTVYAYDADRELTSITRPDGQTIRQTYDNAGRLSSITTPTSTINYAYDGTTGNLSTASIGGGESLSYGYNGPLQTSVTLAGIVNGATSRVFDNNFWVTSESINGGNTVNFTYDNDGLLIAAGSLTLKRSPAAGFVTATTLGKLKDARVYNKFGELATYTAKYKTGVLYSAAFARDNDGRVTAKTETIGGATNTFAYTYDTAGRLLGVTENNNPVVSYAYDSNSNRTSATTPSGTVNGTFDNQDRLLTYGNTSFTYTANGELASKTNGSQITNYLYDGLGNLNGATLPNGTAITYITDAENNRVGRQVNGSLVAGYLYSSDNLVAQLDGNNQIVSQFVYASGYSTPDYMVTGGVTYRIFSDQLGSPRLVVNAASGQVVEQIDYDEFGNVINDTNPGFQPFGFAGGLYDQDTKLVHFRARDYDPSIGRWTSKDPILFAGGDTELYGYVLNDPQDMIDPSGHEGCVCKAKDAPKKEDNLEEQTKKAAENVTKSSSENAPKKQSDAFTPPKSSGPSKSDGGDSGPSGPGVSVGGGMRVEVGVGTVSLTSKGGVKMELAPRDQSVTFSGPMSGVGGTKAGWQLEFNAKDKKATFRCGF